MPPHDRRRRDIRGPSEGPWFKAFATTSLEAGDIVRVVSTTEGGAYYNVVPAVADGSQAGDLKVAKADAAAGEATWIKDIELLDLNTAAGALGDFVYLSASVAGAVSLTVSDEALGWVSEVATAGKAHWGPALAAATAPSPALGKVTLVSPTNGNAFYDTIAEAVTASSPGDAVLVGAGTYTEDPMTLTGISVRSLSGADSVEITPTTPTSALFTMGSQSSLYEVLIDGVNGVGGKAVYFPAGTDGAYVEGLHLKDCTAAVEVDATGKDSGVRECIYERGSGDYFIKVNSGAHMQAYDCQLMTAVSLTDALHVDGGTLHVFSGHFDGDGVTDGILVKNGGVVYVEGVHLHDFDHACHVEATDGKLYLLACDILNSTTYDVLTDGADTQVFLGGTVLERDKVSAASGTTLHGSAVVRTDGEEGTQLYGEISQGTPGQPGEIAAGEGDSYTLGMTVFSHDGAATWVDHTAAASSASASTFSAHQSTASGEILYIGGNDFRFNGIKVDGGGTAQVIGAGSGVWEYYDTGATWVAFNVMASDAVGLNGGQQAQKAQNVFEITSTSDQVRFNMVDLTSTAWVKTTVNGVNAYWVRYRLTGAITTVATLQRIKLGSNRTEVGTDGGERYGSAIKQEVYWEGTGEGLSVPSGGANGPTNLDVTVGPGISYQQANSNYASGSDVRRAGTMLAIPHGLDTSRPGTLRIVWKTNGTSTNAVRWDFYSAQVAEGDVLGALASVLNTQTPAGAAQADEVQITDFVFDISSLIPGDFFSFMLWRLGTTDTNPDTAGVLTMQFIGYSWQ